MTKDHPECGRLAVELRGLRARSGLSLVALAAGSAYSKSSWERYLNAKAMPPWPAVQALCRLADEPEPKVRALWELADAAWSGRGAVTVAVAVPDPPIPPPGPEATPQTRAAARRWGRLRTRAAVLVGVALVCTALTAGAGYEWDGVSPGRALPTPNPASTAFRVKCGGQGCSGQDPTAMLCGVLPLTLAQGQTGSGAGMEIRYNAQCRAAWTRVWHTQVGDDVTISAPGQPVMSVRVPSAAAAQTFLYTPMVAVTARHTVLRACLVPPAGAPKSCLTATSP
jgi:hypothetical protein